MALDNKIAGNKELHLVYLGLGSNLGNRTANLQRGLELLGEAGVRICGCSHLYRTAPWGGVSQPDFYNMAAMVRTALAPRVLLYLVKQVEYIVGRRPGTVWGPRVLDIDILLYDRLIYEGTEGTEEEPDKPQALAKYLIGKNENWELTFDLKKLTIPHKELHRRAFVLAPLAELAAELEVPGLGRSVGRLLAELPVAEWAEVVQLPSEEELKCHF